MSIASEITRLQGVKSDILTAIADKGVTVPSGSALDDCPALIASIPTGAPEMPTGYIARTAIWLDGTTWDGFILPEISSTTDLLIQIDFQSKASSSSLKGILVGNQINNNTCFSLDQSNTKIRTTNANNQSVENTVSYSMANLSRQSAKIKNDTFEITNGVNNYTCTIPYTDQSLKRISLAGSDFYIFRIYLEQGNLKMDLWPAQRISDGRYGFIDVVTGNFYFNQYFTGL